MGSIGTQDEDSHNSVLSMDSTFILTRIAAGRLKEISAGNFSTEVRQKATLTLLDFLGAAQSGLLLPLSHSVLKYAARHPDQPEAYVFGIEKAMSAETAAFTNTVLAHCAARDDMHLDSCAHMGGIVVSTVLAISQRDKWTGEQIIRGIIGGYEMGAVLGTAIRSSVSFNKHLRPSGLIGAFAAASAAIAATYEDEEVAVNALSLAVNMACGVNEWAHTGGEEIFIQNGTASRAGITAYDQARCGITSSDSVLEGRDGFLRAVNAGPDAANTFRNWIQTSPVGRGIIDVRFKPAPTCNFTQTTSALALRLAQRKIDMAELQQINITTTSGAMAYPGCNNAGPLRSSASGKLSIQYGVCAALAFGRLDEECLARVHHESVNRLMAKCSVAADSTYDEKYKEGLQPARIELVLHNGTVLREEASDVPWLNGPEVIARFLREISPLLSEEKAQRLLYRCQHLGDTDIRGDLLGV
ncbi:hypothetical protein LTR99_008591 [Exophiala xenobiotica]|uniref:2-methylcitrate dehydratase PrpD n=1 Tax=Vermiconidia calcicola TaxID=1690605 RepID=A0AAV9Q035_9PEZI|nr:hypothetical protein H2202_004352 [Exophiala xenobiotica]KAK5532980.1 hypothetical protein LTR25_007685 [Vermiconidia calcicola]KAK5534314.1 hypothetical protein LTR23_008743 [Chaetothyriales sp. CCFEE 6169]KAK5191682.1 hypothetical protein LTR92_008262 [Exophiala xenobiotica]KAK5211243.1 hypothetical protein LTR41_002702 [Exophiala xenobiotica]